MTGSVPNRVAADTHYVDLDEPNMRERFAAKANRRRCCLSRLNRLRHRRRLTDVSKLGYCLIHE